MTGIIETVGIGILTNVIYDIVKYAGIKFSSNKKIKDRELLETIEERLSKNVPEEIKPLLESSTFVGYFSSAQFLDVINAYTEYKIICDYTGKNSKVKQHIKKSGILSNQDVMEYIGNNIHNLYIEHGVLTVPNLTDIKKAVVYIIALSEKIISETLSPETSRFLYFINSRIDYCYESITEKLSKLQETVDGIQAKRLTGRNSENEETKEKYHKILKDKNSDAHIYLLDKFPFEKFYVPPILQRASIERNQIHVFDLYGYGYYERDLTAWKDIFEKDNIVYLTGGAGYGKSLFTKKIINNYTDLKVFHADEYVVIYGELKSFYPNGSDSAISVIDFLKDCIKNSTLMEVSDEFIEYYLNSGRCIILLDALDEVDKQKRSSLHESVVAFFKNQNPNNKICITSRDRGFIPERNVEVFKILPLNEEQIEKYVDKIIALKKFEKADKEAFMNQSQILVEKGFLSSFLVLSLLINIYKAERELPENKLELYQKCFEYIANRREKDKTQKEFDWRIISPIMKDNTFIELAQMGMPNNSNIDRENIKERLLQVYKSKYGSEAEAENAIDEFLKFCSDRTELFVPTLEDKYKFFHRSFFEYFYSLYIFLRCNNAQEMLAELQKFDVDSEVFELTVAMLKQQSEMKYQALIDLMFLNSYSEFENEPFEFQTFNILVLSMQVIDDALYKKQFLEIVLNKKDIILNHMSKIHNLKLIPTIFDGNEDAFAKICEYYNEECLMMIFSNCDRIFRMADEYKKDHNEDFFEQIISGKRGARVQRRISYKSHDDDNSFLMNVFSRQQNCKEILLTVADDTIMSIYKKFSHRNYKKRTTQTRTTLTRFSMLSEEQQNKIAELIVSSDFRM